MAAHDKNVMEYPFTTYIIKIIHTYIHTYIPIHIKFYPCDDNGGIHTRSHLFVISAIRVVKDYVSSILKTFYSTATFGAYFNNRLSKNLSNLVLLIISSE